jgi:heavy metal sensor kinase
VTLTLRGRLAAISTVVFGLLVGSVSLTTYHVLARSLDADVTASLFELSEGLHGYLRFEGDTVSVAFDPDDGQQATFVHRATQYYQVYDAGTGRLLAESSGMKPLGLQLTRTEVQSLRDRPEPIDILTEYGRFRLACSVRIAANGRAYLLQVGVSLAQIDGVLRRYRSLLLWRVPAILLVAVLVFWWLAQFALRPLSYVAAAAQDIDVSTLERRLPVRGVHDELDRVAESFNQTLERLATAVGDMRQFSAALAHELRTPLAVVRGQIELALHAPGIGEAQRDAFGSQIEEIDRLTRLIDRVLTFARAESGQIRLTFSRVRLDDLVRSLVEQVEPLAEARSIALGCGRLDAVVVDGDGGWLGHMVLNLLDNALKYTGPQGRIEVRVVRAGETARVEVSDTGIGLSPDHAQHVFERFFRVDPARSSETAGAGLGLSLVRWVAEQHQGTARVSSRFGEGSTFTVSLPLRGE